MIGAEPSPIAPSTAALAHQTAKIETIQQKNGLPWRCGTVRQVVTPAYCREHLHEFPCNECTRPRIMGWDKEVPMPSGKCECCGITATIYRKAGVNRCYRCHIAGAIPMELPAGPVPDESPVPAAPELPATTDDVIRPIPRVGTWPDRSADTAAQAEEAAEDIQPIPRRAGFPTPEDDTAPDFSWDDFTPYRGMTSRAADGLYATMSNSNMRLSAEVSKRLGLVTGGYLEVSYRDDIKALAVRMSSSENPHALKIAGYSGRSQARIASSGLRKAFGITITGRRIPVTITTWGAIVHLDRADLAA